MGLINDLLSPILGGVGIGAGLVAQRQTARFCFKVSQRATGGRGKWEKLSEEVQNEWCAAVWDEIEKHQKKG